MNRATNSGKFGWVRGILLKPYLHPSDSGVLPVATVVDEVDSPYLGPAPAFQGRPYHVVVPVHSIGTVNKSTVGQLCKGTNNTYYPPFA